MQLDPEFKEKVDVFQLGYPNFYDVTLKAGLKEGCVAYRKAMLDLGKALHKERDRVLEYSKTLVQKPKELELKQPVPMEYLMFDLVKGSSGLTSSVLQVTSPSLPELVKEIKVVKVEKVKKEKPVKLPKESQKPKEPKKPKELTQEQAAKVIHKITQDALQKVKKAKAPRIKKQD